MKRLFTLMLLLAAVCLNSFAIHENAIVLHHGDEVTVFDGPRELENALNAAVDGDYLYMGKGSFGGFTISKKIYIRGAGDNQTQINGSIDIKISANEDDPATYSEPIIEGLYVTNNIVLYNYTKGLKISKCQLSKLYISSGTHKETTIDRCFLTDGITYSNSFEQLLIVNCQLGNFYPSGTTRDDVTILNSNVYRFNSCTNAFRGTIINSILGYTYEGYNTNSNSYGYHGRTYYEYYRFEYTKFINTLVHYYFEATSTCETENLYTDESYNSAYSLLNWSGYQEISNDELLEKNYLGTDGKIVGAYGGDTPYTLTISTPRVKSTSLEVDNINKKLNVKITLFEAKDKEDTKEEEATKEENAE